MNDVWPIVSQIFLNLLEFAMQGTATMPCIMILALAMGRKGHGAFCLFATLRLGFLTFCLSIIGVAYFLGSYLNTMFGMGNYQFFDTFFMPAAMNYSLSLLAWFAGMGLFYVAWLNLRGVDARLFARQVDRYDLKSIKVGIILFFLAGLCYFMTFIIFHWPFGGFPESLTRERVIMAILRNSVRAWFMALAPAGSMACVFAVWERNKQAGISREVTNAATRWCAFWAFIGYLPVTIQNAGILLGASAGAYKNFVAGYYSQVTGTMFVVCGMACFAVLLFRKQSSEVFAWLGLILYLCARTLPKILFSSVYNF